MSQAVSWRRRMLSRIVTSCLARSRVPLCRARSLSPSLLSLRVSRGLCGGNKPPPDSWAARFWTWTCQVRPHWRESPTEAAVAFCVFGVTGSTSVALVRPFLKTTIGLEGSMREGPWSYRITSLVLVSPIYATLLVTFGTVAGRHRFFAYMASKIFGRFLPKPVIQHISNAFGWCFPRSRQ